MYSYGDIHIISLSAPVILPWAPLNTKYMMMVLQVVVAQAGVINGLQDGYHGGLVVGGGGQAGGEDDGPAGQER